MSPVEILRAARNKISDPSKWTTDTYARDGKGKAVGPDSSNAVCWCALGAIFAVAGHTGDEMYAAKGALYAVAQEELNKNGVAALNDEDGYEAVLLLYDKAIANAERRS